jgi:hypothetical protein
VPFRHVRTSHPFGSVSWPSLVLAGLSFHCCWVGNSEIGVSAQPSTQPRPSDALLRPAPVIPFPVSGRIESDTTSLLRVIPVLQYCYIYAYPYYYVHRSLHPNGFPEFRSKSTGEMANDPRNGVRSKLWINLCYVSGRCVLLKGSQIHKLLQVWISTYLYGLY